jgi:hypothetical protein
MYKMVQIWPGRFVCKQITVCPGHIWTTLYIGVSCILFYSASLCRAICRWAVRCGVVDKPYWFQIGIRPAKYNLYAIMLSTYITEFNPFVSIRFTISCCCVVFCVLVARCLCWLSCVRYLVRQWICFRCSLLFYQSSLLLVRLHI